LFARIFGFRPRGASFKSATFAIIGLAFSPATMKKSGTTASFAIAANGFLGRGAFQVDILADITDMLDARSLPDVRLKLSFLTSFAGCFPF